MSNLQAVRGTKDYFFEEQAKFSKVVSVATEVAKLFAYQEASTPILEFSEVFKRSLGDYSDVVNKEMYSFDDRKGKSLTLRPEFTASIMRAIITNGLYNQMPMRIFSWGPLFRYERPQKGRMRQFHQINVENVGTDSPFSDAEVISLGHMVLTKLGIGNDRFSLEINSLGDKDSRQKYLGKLVEYYTKYATSLSEDSKLRLEKNPLRILDSKDAGDKKINQDAPKIHEYLNADSARHFDLVKQNLSDLGIKYNINHLMVRGLDYYNHTAFEFVTSELGAQGALIAGGRYNGLISQLGGKDYPAVGFGGGIERMAELMRHSKEPTNLVSIISLCSDAVSESYKLAHKLRESGIASMVEEGTNLSKSMKKALEREAKYALFIGEEEMASGQYKLKNLQERKEQNFTLEKLIEVVQKNEF